MPRKSTGDYPDNWNEIAQEVKEAAGNRCIRCGHVNDIESGYVLTVHHLDINPANCAWWNLAALCQRCHLHIQAKVIMERVWMFEHSEWFKPYVAGYYAHQYGLPEDSGWCIAQADDLIALGQGKMSLSDFESRYLCPTCRKPIIDGQLFCDACALKPY